MVLLNQNKTSKKRMILKNLCLIKIIYRQVHLKAELGSQINFHTFDHFK